MHNTIEVLVLGCSPLGLSQVDPWSGFVQFNFESLCFLGVIISFYS